MGNPSPSNVGRIRRMHMDKKKVVEALQGDCLSPNPLSMTISTKLESVAIGTHIPLLVDLKSWMTSKRES